MGLKESGLRGSLRNVSVGIDAIPDGSLYYFGSSYESGDDIWLDQNDRVDMSLTGDETATDVNGDEAVRFDGDSDHGIIELPSDFEGQDLNEVSIEIAVAFEHTSTDFMFGVANRDENEQRIGLQLNRDENFDSDNGNFYFQLRDELENRLRFSPETNPEINDGSRHDITIIVEDAENNDASIIIDGSEINISFGSQDSPNDFGEWLLDFALSALNQVNQGVVLNSEQDVIGLGIVPSALDEQKISGLI